MFFNKININLTISILLFICLCIVGLLLSQRKILWDDEVYTQRITIDRHSYNQILTLHFDEGNKYPFFYLLQKINSDIFNFRMPIFKLTGFYKIHDNKSQVIIRIPTIIYMSLAVTAVFYFFLKYYGTLPAFYSLLVSLVTPSIWLYWAEARPYSILYLLTVLQLISITKIYYLKDTKANVIFQLSAIHLLLAFTSMISILQIFFISIAWLLKEKRIKDLLFIFILPTLVVVFYMLNIHLFLIKADNILPHLMQLFPIEHYLLLISYLIFNLIYRLRNNIFLQHASFILIYLIFLICALIVIFKSFMIKSAEFGFNNRYLIFAIPANIFMMTFVFIDFLKLFKTKSIYYWNFILFFIGLLIVRGYITYLSLLSSGNYFDKPL